MRTAPEFQPILQRRARAGRSPDARARGSTATAARWTPQRLQAHAQPPPARRAGRDRRQPRALHPRADRRRRASSCPPGQRPRDRARAGDARLLGRLGRARQRLGRSRDRRPQRAACACRRARSRTCCGASGSRDEEEQGYYYGFSNEGLWPLCHIAHTRPDLPRGGLGALPGRQPEVRRRRRATRSTPTTRSSSCRTTTSRSRPRLIRERLPRATIITFWHIPWPNAERFGICPWREELLEGMLGSSILGFHTQLHCNNFLDCGRPLPRGAHRPRARRRRARRHAARSCGPTRSPSSGRTAGLAAAPPADECRASVLRGARTARPTRCSASASTASTTPRASRSACSRSSGCSRRFPSSAGRFTFVQLAAPSRTAHRALPAAERARRGGGRSASTSASATGAYRPIVAAARAPRAARRSSATTAPPTSAT